MISHQRVIVTPVPMNNKYTNLLMNNSFLVFLESCGGNLQRNRDHHLARSITYNQDSQDSSMMKIGLWVPSLKYLSSKTQKRRLYICLLLASAPDWRTSRSLSLSCPVSCDVMRCCCWWCTASCDRIHSIISVRTVITVTVVPTVPVVPTVMNVMSVPVVMS